MAYPAIRTQFLGATNTKGSRIKATVGGDKPGSASLPYDHAYDQFTNHERVAEELAYRTFGAGWGIGDSELIAGEVARGYEWVPVTASLITALFPNGHSRKVQ